MKGKGKGKGWYGGKGGVQALDGEEGNNDWEGDWKMEEGSDKTPSELLCVGHEPGWMTVGNRFTKRRMKGSYEGSIKDVMTIGCVDRICREVNAVASTPGWERIRVQVDSGAVDTVTPKCTASAFKLKPTEASRRGIGFVAANGTRIQNYGEKKVIGYTDGGEGVSMKMQCADVQKTLASVHRMNQGGNVVVLDGANSYMVNKESKHKTRIGYENGQYVFHIWVPSDEKEADKDEKTILKGNRYSVLACDEEEEYFMRQDRR